VAKQANIARQTLGMDGSTGIREAIKINTNIKNDADVQRLTRIERIISYDGSRVPIVFAPYSPELGFIPPGGVQ